MVLMPSPRDCLGTYDPTQSVWTDTSVDNAWRSWFWIVYALRFMPRALANDVLQM
jgi:hypothetical protein